MNHDNILSAIPRVYAQTSKSAKTGNDYTQICIEFSNGYIYKGFLNDEQKKLIDYAVQESRDARQNSESQF